MSIQSICKRVSMKNYPSLLNTWNRIQFHTIFYAHASLLEKHHPKDNVSVKQEHFQSVMTLWDTAFPFMLREHLI